MTSKTSARGRGRPGYLWCGGAGFAACGRGPHVDWVVAVVLPLSAAALAGQGARLMTAGRGSDEAGEAGTDRAVLALVMVGVTLGLGAVGAAVGSAGAAVAVQVAVCLVAMAVVSLPVVGVVRAGRRERR